MSKSPDAFRTISEVAEWLNTPAHVLRFWESKFTQVKPVKRAGGRRYYRPADMELIGGIKKLLHDDGMTIKGVQKMLREQGVRRVAKLSQPVDELVGTEVEAAPFHEMAEAEDTVVPFGIPGAGAAAKEPGQTSQSELSLEPDETESTAETLMDLADEPSGLGASGHEAAMADQPPDDLTSQTAHSEPIPDFKTSLLAAPEHRPDLPTDMGEPDTDQDAAGQIGADADLPGFLTSPTFPDQGTEDTAPAPDLSPEADVPPADESEPADAASLADSPASAGAPAAPEPAPEPVFASVPADGDIQADPGALSHLSRIRRLSPEDATKIAVAAEQLRALNARLSSH